ncbi:MND1-interacting protein 1-like [Melia azedarach]|uniref:MND1-interacting protein 1-like n=1 Tax=Melia azedarach TaxID=155640 RepID=A0ACC1YUZ1_MELAZ|nr:MND1-interacting protein 1-like [Melia azedarach]
MASKSRKNIAKNAAAYHAHVKVSPDQLQAVNNPWQSKRPTEQFESEEPLTVKLVLCSCGSLSLDQKTEGQFIDPKLETISSLADQINVVKKQVQECKEWAHKRVIQAARKMNNDLTELRSLRMDDKENQLDKNCKVETDETPKKRLMEMDNALK